MADPRELVAKARELRQAGDLRGAVNALLRAGAPSEAVRMLVDEKRFLDAGRLVLHVLKVGAADVGKLAGKSRQYARRAAEYFAAAGDHATARQIFAALGDPVEEALRSDPRPPARQGGGGPAGAGPRAPTPPSGPREAPVPAAAPPSARSQRSGYDAARELEAAGRLAEAREAYLRLRRPVDAARVARQQGDVADAARLFADGGRHYDAALCRLEQGDLGEALALFVRVPRDDPDYRGAAAQAIAVASELNAVDFDLDRFVARYLRSGPQDDAEIEAFYTLGRLYEANGFDAAASQVYQQLLAVAPHFRDVASRLGELVRDARGTDLVFEKIVRDDERFEGLGHRDVAAPRGLPELPPLPELPSLDEIERSRPRPSLPLAPDDGYQAPPVPASQRRPPVPGSPPRPAAGEPEGPLDAKSVDRLPPGTHIAGRYRVVRLLGSGGMAAVYEVHDEEIDLAIALKLFSADLDELSLVERFRRELMLTRELAHPNIVRVHDIGVHQQRRFLTMELLVGTELEDIIVEGPLPLVRAVDYLEQACRGLYAAHQKQIVHRDVKPTNLFVTSADVVKVTDFGIAKKAGDQKRLTSKGFTAGTPAYMAPEQIQDFAEVTAHCDIYALGIVGFEMLIGDVPFLQEEAMSLMYAHVHAPVPSLCALRPEIPPVLEEVIMHALAKKPSERIQSCDEFAARLRAIRHLLAR